MSIKNYVEKRVSAADTQNIKDIQHRVSEHLEKNIPLPLPIEFKIRRKCLKYGWKRSEILSAVVLSKVAASVLAISAEKQSIAEKAQIGYLKERGLPVVKLASTGSDSVRLLRGDLCYGLGKHVDATKAIDCVCGHDFLYLKWTKEQGGAQDNQASDVIDFLKKAKRYVNKHDDSVRFIAIVDGDFYDEKKVNILNKFTNERVLVRTSDTYNLASKQHKVNSVTK